MTALTVISAILMFLFILPVFTGQVVNIGNVTGFLCGLFLWQLAHHPSLIHHPWIIVLCVLLAGCLLTAALIAYRMIRVMKLKADGSETLVILGCEILGEQPSLMQVERLEAALKYLDRYPGTNVICSGGQGKKEKISEAEAMRIWLEKHGIRPQRIYKEDRSETTQENIRFSKAVIEREGLERTVAVCTNEFHLYRAVQMARSLGLEARAVAAPTAWWLFPTFCVREFYAILYFTLKNRKNH